MLPIEYPHGQVRALTHYGIEAAHIERAHLGRRDALEAAGLAPIRRVTGGDPVADRSRRVSGADRRTAGPTAPCGRAHRGALRRAHGDVARVSPPTSASTPRTIGWPTCARAATVADMAAEARFIRDLEAIEPAGALRARPLRA